MKNVLTVSLARPKREHFKNNTEREAYILEVAQDLARLIIDEEDNMMRDEDIAYWNKVLQEWDFERVAAQRAVGRTYKLQQEKNKDDEQF